MSTASSSTKIADSSHGVNAEVSKRVELCLEKCQSYAEFKEERHFKFLHLFAGPRDVLAEALRDECEKEGLKVVVESYDKLIDASHDLLAERPFTDILKKAKEGDYDGGHAGFPCGSFSRARYNLEGEGPKPVRSGAEIYGLATNSRAQQQEADRGTVMAVRSAMIINEVIQSQRRRAVPSVGTLENPPGSETGEEGPAWALPELMSFEGDLGTTTALFNTCAYQTKLRYKGLSQDASRAAWPIWTGCQRSARALDGADIKL